MVRPASPRAPHAEVPSPGSAIFRRCMYGLAALRFRRRLLTAEAEMCAGGASYRALYAPDSDSEDLFDGAMINVDQPRGGHVADAAAPSPTSSSSSMTGDDAVGKNPSPAHHHTTQQTSRPRRPRPSVVDTRPPEEPHVRTRSMTCNRPEHGQDAPSFVRRGDPFVVRVLGVVATAHDWHIGRGRVAGKNELVVWSERGDATRRRHRAMRRNARKAAGIPVAASPLPGGEAATAAMATSSAGADAAGPSVPTLHFDFAERGGFSSAPGRFVPVPASRSIAVRELGCGPTMQVYAGGSSSPVGVGGVGGALSRGRSLGASSGTMAGVPWRADIAPSMLDEDDAPSSINLRLHVAEVDDTSLLNSVSSFVSASSRVSNSMGSSGMGYIAETVGGEAAGSLAEATSGAGQLAELALQRAARTDMVLSVDKDFRLLPRAGSGGSPSPAVTSAGAPSRRSQSPDSEWQAATREPPPIGRSEYLRYGTLFFLSEAVPQRLYARLDDALNVALCTRTPPPVTADGRVGLATYTPLQGVSYAVVRVERLEKVEAAAAALRSPSPLSLSPSSSGWKRVIAARSRIAEIRR